jgi:hypothetical protein
MRIIILNSWIKIIKQFEVILLINYIEKVKIWVNLKEEKSRAQKFVTI